MKIKTYTPATEKIAELLFNIMQRAMQGGLPEKEAIKIYDTILSNLCKLDKSQSQYDVLLEDILNYWALPLIMDYGVSTNKIEQISLN
ncbi:MAG: hypothetical protein WC223_10740 [Bacteroidales bacterium]|jgi:hypothetical protein